MTIKDALTAANAAYHKSVDIAELTNQAGTVTNVLKDPYIYENLYHDGKALLIKIMVKIKALNYFCGGYDKADYESLVSYINGAVKVAEQNNYKKSKLLCEEVLKAAEEINSVFFDAYAQKCLLVDGGGNRVAQTCEECESVKKVFQDKKTAVLGLDFNPEPFGTAVAFGDIRAQAAADLDEIILLCGEFSEEIRRADAGKMLEECSEDISGLKSQKAEYYPRNDMIERAAKALVISTPFYGELELFAVKYSTGGKLYKIKISYFDDRQTDSIRLVFDELISRQADCIVEGVYSYRGDKNALYRELMRFGKSGRYAFIWDKKSDRSIYNAALKAVGGDLSILDISFTYLGMPDFKDVVEIFEQEEMLKNANLTIDDVRAGCRFMGFEGLNKAMQAYKLGNKTDTRWFELAKDYSARRESAAIEFLREIPNAVLFIDSGWGVEVKTIDRGRRREFDYDDIKVSNPNNIRKIMTSEFSLFQKCGLIATYCTLHNQDVSRWKDIESDERAERITEATQLVMRALDVGIKPVVELVDDDGGSWGGMCCDGGKRIIYKKRCTDDYAWMVDAICHECFHAFQHKAESEGFSNWFWTELGVTRGRISKWAYNFRYYKDIPKRRVEGSPYMTQIVESDARAFAEDSLDSTDKLISSIDFE